MREGVDLQTLIKHETSRTDFGVFTRPLWCTLIALARPKILQCMLSPPSRDGRPKPFLVAIQVVSASRLGGLKSHGVACAPTAPTQEYRKRGAGTRFAAIRSMSQHVISVTLNRAVPVDSCSSVETVSSSVITLDSLLGFGGLVVFVVSSFRGPRSGASDCDTRSGSGLVV